MIDSSTGLYCIFGSPVRHSLSPLMHNAAFSECGINAVYLAFEPSSVDHAVDSIRSLPISGASITIPFKTAVIPFLDRIDPLAGEIGAVNTIRNSNGILEGFNTDGMGALGAIEEFSGSIHGKKVLILGTGGSSRAIAFTLLSKGAVVTIAGRQGDSRKNLLADLRRNHNSINEIDITALDRESVHCHEIIINTTPLGMGSSDSAPINTDLIIPDHTVFDIVYHPH
ncbi:MAG TPA: shikimate dehydrogenase, partial [Spirochaetota bacterium]|nr:shikimate dehydrogenase [Spirochaetota bacterium]